MESSRARPAGAVDTAGVPELARLVEAPGPFVSVYLNTEAAVENAAQRNELRWKDLRRSLQELEAPAAALEAIDPLIADAHHQGRTLAVVAGPDGLLVVRHEAEPVKADIGRVGPLPSIGPILDWIQGTVPHVVVVADRAGADLIAVGGAGQEVLASVGPNRGNDPSLRKSQPGGWSQRRYQHRAEIEWEERAAEVADRVGQMVADIGARLVLVAGDTRALQFLRQHLPAEITPLVREMDGSRGIDGNADEMSDEIVRQVATAAAAESTEFVRRWKEDMGQGSAVEGVNPVMAALREARVDTLLVHDDPSDERAGWFLPEAGMVAEGPVALGELNLGEEPESARLVDVAIFGALRSGAGVRVVPSIPADGMGALLRY